MALTNIRSDWISIGYLLMSLFITFVVLYLGVLMLMTVPNEYCSFSLTTVLNICYNFMVSSNHKNTSTKFPDVRYNV